MRIAIATTLFLLALATEAAAGGWAVTTLDPLPPELRAGQTYDVGYTIRQHGVTPVDVSKMGGTTRIVATSSDNRTVSFDGVSSGATGHYVARVSFPTAGTWQWQVTQGPFAPQALGTVTILAPVAAPAADPAGAPVPAGPNPFLVVSLLLAASGAAVLFGTRAAAFAARASA